MRSAFEYPPVNLQTTPHQERSRPFWTVVCIVCFLPLLALCTLPSQAAHPNGAEIPLRWQPRAELRSGWLTGPPRDPAVSVKVAIPSGAGVEVVLSDVSPRWEHAPDQMKTDYRGPTLTLGHLGVWRGQRYQEVLIHPLRQDADGAVFYLAALEAILRVKGSPGLSPRPLAGATLQPEASAFINPGDAAGHAPAIAIPENRPVPSSREVTLPAGSIRIEIAQDGLYRVNGQYLLAHGLPSGTAVENLHMRCRGVELPLLVEGPSSGPVTSSTALVFYGQGLRIRDRPLFSGGDFSGVNVYWLCADDTPGVRMPQKPAGTVRGFATATSFFASVHLETNTQHDPVDHFRPNGDNWFWGPVFYSAPAASATRDYAVTLPHPTGNGLSVTAVTASINTGTHGMSLKLDGAVPDSGPSPLSWTGKALATGTWQFAAGPSEGAHTLTLVLPGVPGQNDVQFFDYFDLDYRRTFDADSEALLFTDANADASYASPGYASAPYILDLSAADAATGLKLPVLLTGAEFSGGTATFEMAANPAATDRVVALSSAPLLPDAAYPAAPPVVLTPGNAADMVIITHPDFHPAGADEVWQAYFARRSAAMRVMTVDIESIYNTYSYGLLDPTAIRSFLTDAAGVWGTPPKFVLLMGDASYDYKNYTSTPGNKNWVPTMMFDDLGDSTYMGRYPSDAWFADVNGDGYPDSAVGRLPAQSYEELAGMLTKIMAYEDQALSGAWYKSGLFVADTWTQSWEQVFEEANTLLGTTYMTPPWIANYLFFHNSPYNGTDADAFAAAVRGAWPGSALLHYSGHSGISSLGNHYAFFTSYTSRNCSSGTCQDSDVDLLPPIDLTPATLFAPLPFFVSSSCYNSAFDELGTPALMKALVTRADRGSIGSCGFSTIAYPDQEHTFANAFFNLAFGRSKVRAAGDLVEAGRFSLASSDARSVMGNILLGDPSLHLRLPAPPPPASLAATPLDGASRLSWSSPPETVSHFGLYRSEDGGETWGLVADPPSSDRTFTDGGLINGLEYTYYLTSWDTEGFEGSPSVMAAAVPEPGLCTVTCQALVPSSGVPGATVTFQGSATKASCLGDLLYDWDFGDGSAHSHDPDPAHAFTLPGQYAWRFTASADSASCTKSGSITVAVPPQVTGVKKAANPFRVILTGSGMHSDIAAYLGEQRWTTLKIIPGTKVTLKGAGLKSFFPANTFVSIRLVNGDGGETTVSYNRTTGQWH